MVRLAILVATLTACVDTDVGLPSRVEVLTLTGVDTATGRGQYALSPVEVPELVSLDPLHDRDFSFIAEPTIDVSTLQPSAVNRHADYTPRVREIEGVAVPRDMTSLQVLSAYNAFRTVIAVLPELTGEDPAAVLPASGFAVWVYPRIEEGAVSSTMTANAFYASGYDVFGLVGIDPIERLPVGAAQPVLAHEFGHHLFHRSFAVADGECDPENTDPEAPGRFTAEAAISGFNEGYGDLVSFAVTGVLNPLADAFPDSLAGDRTIDVRLPGAVAFGFDDGLCDGGFYCVGTLFTRSLYEAAVARGEDLTLPEVRMALARDVYRALALMPAALRQRLALVQPFENCAINEDIDANLVSPFVDEMITLLPVAARPSLCERFIANFGASGYKLADRKACP